MKRIILGITVILVAVLAVSCTHSSPKNVAKAYIKALKSQDAKKLADCYYYEGSDEQKDQQKQLVIALADKVFKGIEAKQGIDSFKIDSVEEKGDDKAIVHATITYGNGETETDNIETIKKNGKWYVDE